MLKFLILYILYTDYDLVCCTFYLNMQFSYFQLSFVKDLFVWFLFGLYYIIIFSIIYWIKFVDLFFDFSIKTKGDIDENFFI